MKSKITIDVDFDNQPIIKIDYVATDDIRDKLIKRFLETFEGESSWAKFSFGPSDISGPNSSASLRPIPPHDLDQEVQAAEGVYKNTINKLKNIGGPSDDLVYKFKKGMYKPSIKEKVDYDAYVEALVRNGLLEDTTSATNNDCNRASK